MGRMASYSMIALLLLLLGEEEVAINERFTFLLVCLLLLVWLLGSNLAGQAVSK